MNFLKNPNLPSNNVNTVIIGSLYKEIAFKLNMLGIQTLFCGENSPLAGPVKFHSDMLVNYMGNGNIIIGQNEKSLFKSLVKMGYNVEFPSHGLQDKYPGDIALNCTWLNEKLICGSNADDMILKYAYSNFIKAIYVKQGYTRCSMCVVDDNSIITSDISIYKSCIGNDIDVLLISPGYISLPGYDTGFIGGACAKINKNLLLFFGDLSKHPNEKEIKEFCFKKEVETFQLFSGNLMDIGGIIQIAEQ